jgi:WD40 repeat protein
MKWTLPRFRFGLRTLLAVTFLAGIGAWLYTNRPERQRAYRNQVARSRIDAYELSVARDEHDGNVPPELVAILGDSRLKHWGPGGGVKLLDGEQVASSSRDGVVRIWSAETGRQLHTFHAKSFATSGDRKLLFLALADGTIRCWDVAAAKQAKIFGEPTSAEQISLAVNTDGNWLVAEYRQPDWSREIVVWNVVEKRAAQRLRPQTTGGGALSITAAGDFFTWENESRIEVSETATGNVIRSIGPITDGSSKYRPGQVQLSSDESKLYVGNSSFRVFVFDVATGEELEQIGRGFSSVHSFAMDPNSIPLVFGGQDELRIFAQWEKDWVARHGDTIPSGHLHGVDVRGITIAGATDDGIAMWNSGNTLVPWRFSGGAPRSIRRVAFDPGSRSLFTADSLGQVAVWELGTWQQRRDWNAHNRPIDTLVFSADGSRLLTAANDGTAVIWESNTNEEIAVRRESDFMRQVGLSPDGKYGVGAPRELSFTPEFEIFDASTGKTKRKAGPIQGGILSPPAWSSDGKKLAFVDHSGSFLIFDTQSWKSLGSVGKTRFAQQAVVAAWLSDNRRLVTTNWGRDEVHVVEVGKTTPVLTLNAGTGRAKWVAVHPTEEWIAVCGSEMPVQIWHLPTSKLVKSWQLGPLAGEVRQVAFSPDGHYLATVNGNGTVYVLSLDGVLK